MTRTAILFRQFEPFSGYKDPDRYEWQGFEDCEGCPWSTWNLPDGHPFYQDETWDYGEWPCFKGHGLWDVPRCDDLPVYRQILFRKFNMEEM
jgi:hypothetical protein